jgi:hypothetical protein
MGDIIYHHPEDKVVGEWICFNNNEMTSNCWFIKQMYLILL